MARLRYIGIHGEGVDVPDAGLYGIKAGDDVDVPDDVAYGRPAVDAVTEPHPTVPGAVVEIVPAVPATSGLLASGHWAVATKKADKPADTEGE